MRAMKLSSTVGAVVSTVASANPCDDKNVRTSDAI